VNAQPSDEVLAALENATTPMAEASPKNSLVTVDIVKGKLPRVAAIENIKDLPDVAFIAECSHDP